MENIGYIIKVPFSSQNTIIPFEKDKKIFAQVNAKNKKDLSFKLLDYFQELERINPDYYFTLGKCTYSDTDIEYCPFYRKQEIFFEPIPITDVEYKGIKLNVAELKMYKTLLDIFQKNLVTSPYFFKDDGKRIIDEYMDIYLSQCEKINKRW